jgi:hypothetical protein
MASFLARDKWRYKAFVHVDVVYVLYVLAKLIRNRILNLNLEMRKTGQGKHMRRDCSEVGRRRQTRKGSRVPLEAVGLSD